MTPQEVLDTSVAQLETLAAFMREQLGKDDDGPRRITTETHACDEILGTLRALIVRVRAIELPEEGFGRCPFLRSNDELESKRASGEST
jgi:hypothetical protein